MVVAPLLQKKFLGHGLPMITNNDVILYFASLKPKKFSLV